MSSDASVDPAAVAALFNQLYFVEFSGTAASVLFLYNSIITLDREVAYFWSAKPTGAALLFFANKWINITAGVVLLASFASTKRLVQIAQILVVCFDSTTMRVRSCSFLAIFGNAINLLEFVPWAVFSGLRAHALSRHKVLGVFVTALSLTPMGANLAEFGYDVSGENFPPFGCLAVDNVTSSVGRNRMLLSSLYQSTRTVLQNHTVTFISRIPLIVADVLLILITWTRLNRRDALRGMRQSRRLSLSEILFRDGTIYFVVLSMLNIIHLVLSVTAEASKGRFITTFTAPITAILVSRFLVELQAADRAAVRVDLDDALESSSNTMPSFISSLGAFVNPDLELETSLGCDGSRSEPQEEEGGAQEGEIAEQ